MCPKKNTKPRMYIEKHPKCQMNQEVPKQSLFESVWPKCTYRNDIFKLFLSSFKTFFYFTNFFCFITTRFLFYWFLLPWKGKYFAKYLNLNGTSYLSVLNKFWNNVNESVKFCNFNESSLINTVATTAKLEKTNLSHCTRWYSA